MALNSNAYMHTSFAYLCQGDNLAESYTAAGRIILSPPPSLNPPLYEPLAAMDRVRLSRQSAVGSMQDEPRRDAQRGLGAFHAGDEQTMRARADRRMNRQKGQRAKPASDPREDGAKRVGPVDHEETPARREHRKRSLNPVGKGRVRLRPCQDMRSRSAFVGRDADRLGVEEWRVGDDATGRFNEPRLAALVRLERVEPQDARARLKPVARRVAFGKLRQFGVELDEIDRGKRVALSQRQADCANSRADVNDPALPSVARRRNEQGGVRPDPMAALRLDKQEPAAEPSILG
jgi:hypothetical protein